MSGGSREDLARELADLAVRMQSEVGTESTLASVIDGAVAIVPGARWAGISFVSGNSVEPRVPSDPLVAELDALQTRLDEGPCLSALREEATVLIDDMTTEPLAEIRRASRISRCVEPHVVSPVHRGAQPRSAQSVRG